MEYTAVLYFGFGHLISKIGGLQKDHTWSGLYQSHGLVRVFWSICAYSFIILEMLFVDKAPKISYLNSSPTNIY